MREAPPPRAAFKVSSFNSSGDSYDAPTISLSCGGGSGKIAAGSNKVAESNPIVVTAHPNPATTLARICVEDLPESIPATVEIVNLMGAHIATLYNATPEAELGLCLSLDCSRMPSGTYYARVVNDIMGTTVKFSVEH